MPIPSEDSILQIINGYFPLLCNGVALGRGDDCAIIENCGPMAISSDLFIEDVHFRRSYFTPAEIGRKALAVNLSDLAAMGAAPLAFSLDIALPAMLELQWINDFFKGMSLLAEEFGICLIGGDISKGEKIFISITIFGDVSKGALKRRSAKAGDSIFLIGNVGLARLGLLKLEKKGRDYCQKHYPESLQAHLAPRPKVSCGQILASLSSEDAPIGLMDVSDGLGQDLPRLLGPELGAELQMDETILHPEVLAHMEGDIKKATEFSLRGGEDYALVGTCAGMLAPVIARKVPEMKFIGTVTEEKQLKCNGRLIGSGFDHFEGKRQAWI